MKSYCYLVPLNFLWKKLIIRHFFELLGCVTSVNCNLNLLNSIIFHKKKGSDILLLSIITL